MTYNIVIVLGIQCNNLLHVYITNDYHNKFKYLSHHMVTIIFLAMRTFKIYSLSNSVQICNTVILTTVTVLYMVSKEEKKPAEKYFWKIFTVKEL